jgi:hypothetical protein
MILNRATASLSQSQSQARLAIRPSFSPFLSVSQIKSELESVSQFKSEFTSIRSNETLIFDLTWLIPCMLWPLWSPASIMPKRHLIRRSLVWQRTCFSPCLVATRQPLQQAETRAEGDGTRQRASIQVQGGERGIDKRSGRGRIRGA